MKFFLLPIMAFAILMAFYEESKPDKNYYIICCSIVIFMFGMLRLSAKTPSKNQNNNENDV